MSAGMNLVDSCGWLEYFANGPNADFFAPAIEDTPSLIVPSLCLFEVFKRVLQQRNESDALRAVAVMRPRGCQQKRNWQWWTASSSPQRGSIRQRCGRRMRNSRGSPMCAMSSNGNHAVLPAGMPSGRRRPEEAAPTFSI
jgi:hypothetical protein